MSEKYIVGIDGGSQSCKVTVYNLEGGIVSAGSRELLPMTLAEGGVAEHPGDDLWDALCAASQQAMEAFPGDRRDILGIGIGCIRCCRVLMKRDGTLACPVISWMDARTARPYEHTNPETAYVTSVSGYLTHRLTGERRDCAGNYFGQWPMDFGTWQWSGDGEVIRKYQIPREMLFDVQMPGTVLGRVTEAAAGATGLPAGAPLVGTTADKAVEALGAGLVDGEAAVLSLGTYITLMVTGEKLPKNPESFWAIMSAIPHKYLYESYGIRRGMWTVSWFRGLLGEGLSSKARDAGMSPEELLNREAERVPPGCDGLMTVLDWLANPWEPYKRGVMIGFGAHMDGAYLYRSILEGIALTMKNNFDAMRRELGQDFREIIITGGGSNSAPLMQIFADVFNLPARRNRVNAAAGIGAAMGAAVALGLYSDYTAAARRMVHTLDVFRPVPENAELYRRVNEGVYRGLTKQTDAVLKKSHEIFGAEHGAGSTLTSWSQT